MSDQVRDVDDSSERHDRFVRLLTRNSRRVFAYILALSPNWSDAEDIFQDASVAMWRKFDTYDDDSDFAAWACGVARFEVLHHRRRQRQLRDNRLLSDEAIQALADAALAFAEKSSTHEAALACCVGKLPQSDRAMIEQRYFLSQSPKEIADRSGRSVYSIYRALTRIHEALLRCVRRTLAEEAPA